MGVEMESQMDQMGLKMEKIASISLKFRLLKMRKGNRTVISCSRIMILYKYRITAYPMIFKAPVGQASAHRWQSLQTAMASGSLNSGRMTVVKPLPTSPRIP